MDAEWVRRICMSFPHATEQIQWGDDLVFKVAGKIFAVTPLSPGKLTLSVKVTPEQFAELIEIEGVIPAPYTARNHWIALEPQARLSTPELKRLLRQSYDLVVARLPKKTQAMLKA